MLKIPRKVSILISIVLSALFFVLCAVCAFILPRMTEAIGEWYIFNEGAQLASWESVLINVLSYGLLAIMVLADVLLFLLLMRVKEGKVFTAKSVALIRGVAWCCFAAAVAIGAIGYYFRLALLVAFVALTLGVCLRVVKNVIEEATAIKSENDLTV